MSVLQKINKVNQINKVITANDRTTFTIENLSFRLDAAKTQSSFSSLKKIEKLTCKNSYLRQKIALYKETHAVLTEMQDTVFNACCLF